VCQPAIDCLPPSLRYPVQAADVRGPDGPYRVAARYLAGCDGTRSKVRDTAAIAFPGTTYPEVSRLAQVTMPDR
jgi:2-polyprenyl-6-methoxyphenol hydroxylase-like FAD-dependent oxidoreductase